MSAEHMPAKVSPVEQYRAMVLPEERKRDLFAALPSHVRPEVFERNLVNALMVNPDLMKCDARLVFREVSKAAALGLLLDPQLGEAYLIVGWNGKAQRSEPQLRVGYRGVMKLARQAGDVAKIYAHAVHQNDEIDCTLGDEKRLVHKPILFGDRGPVIGYYAVAVFADGETDFEPMSIGEIHAIRDRSDGWRAYVNKKIKSTPWSTDEGEMAKKTVIRRLLKRLPQSPELMDAIRIEDAAENVIGNAPTPALRGRPQRLSLTNTLEALGAPQKTPPQTIEADDADGPGGDAGEDAATGETVEADPVEEGDLPAAKAQPVAAEGKASIPSWQRGARAARAGDERTPPASLGSAAKVGWLNGYDAEIERMQRTADEGEGER